MLRKNYSFIEIDDNVLIDEVRRVNIYICDEKRKDWDENNKKVDEQWVEIFEHFSVRHIDIANLKKVVEFSLCLPGTNACVEQVFSLTITVYRRGHGNELTKR